MGIIIQLPGGGSSLAINYTSQLINNGDDGSSVYVEADELSIVTANLQSNINTKVDKNTSITGSTKTKITYDAKGLVINGQDATTADINESSNRRYINDADLIDIGNLSGINSGDNSPNSSATSYTDSTVSSASIATLSSANIYTDSKIVQTIINGDATHVSSSDILFDALALKYDLSNPSGFETPTQLNTRDVNNRARSNHTGTQTSSTISDFNSATKAAVVDDSITNGIIDKAPSQNSVYDALALKDSIPFIREISSTTTLGLSDKTLNISSGTFVVNVISAIGIQGRIFTISNNGSGIITLVPDPAETIAGVPTLMVPAECGATIQSNGANWILIDSHRRNIISQTQWIEPIGTVTIADTTSLNLLTQITNTNKSANGTDGGIYELNIATDKILTLWKGERQTHHIRIGFNIVTGSDQHYNLTLRRYSDDSIISTSKINRNSDTGVCTSDFLTYTYGAADPFVTGGFYIQLDNNSGQSVDLDTSINLLIVTYFK